MFCGHSLNKWNSLLFTVAISAKAVQEWKFWVGCLINGSVCRAGSQPRGGKTDSEGVNPSLSAPPGPAATPALSREQLRASAVCRLLVSGHLYIQKLLKTCKELWLCGYINLHLALDVILIHLLIHLKTILMLLYVHKTCIYGGKKTVSS